MVENQSPKIAFHPAPSVGHELGVMFGFMAVFVVAMAVYLAFFKANNRRSEAREIARREELAQKGFGGEKAPVRDDDAIAPVPYNKISTDGGQGELVSGGAGRG
ncbi:hypothetical protein MMC22_005188 [Lobaria immixta]|nr:hypothetical protein [Lobaria immixta]